MAAVAVPAALHRLRRALAVAAASACCFGAAGSASAGALQPCGDVAERDQMLAARMDRLKQDQGLLALLLGQDGSSGGGFGGAFSPAGKESA